MKKYLRPFIGLALSALCLYLAVRKVDPQQVYHSLALADYIWLLPAALCCLGTIWLRARRWRRILAPVQAVPQSRAFHAYAIGNMANMIIPMRAGDVLRALVVGGGRYLPRAAALATVVSERLLDVFSLSLLLVLCLLLYPLPGWVKMTAWWGFGAAMVGILAILMLKRGEELLLKWTSRLDSFAPQRLRDLLTRLTSTFASGFTWPKRARDYLFLGLETVAIWLAPILSVYFAFLAFDLVSLYHLGFLEALVVLSITAVGVAVPSAPGFVGTFHFMGTLSLGLMGVPKSVGLSFIIVLHAANLVIALLVGLYSLKREGLTLGLFKSQLGDPAASEQRLL